MKPGDHFEMECVITPIPEAGGYEVRASCRQDEKKIAEIKMFLTGSNDD
jgi:hypothetical protein